MQVMGNNLKIALTSIPCFTDDIRLDIGEDNDLPGIAMADNVIADDEKKTLANILTVFQRVTFLLSYGIVSKRFVKNTISNTALFS